MAATSPSSTPTPGHKVGDVSHVSQLRYAFSILLEVDYRSDEFKEHLTFEYAGENYAFWKAVYGWKSDYDAGADKKKLRKQLIEIYDKFVAEAAPQEINVPTKSRIALKNKLEKKVIERSMLDELVFEVEDMMVKGSFPRFAGKVSDRVEKSWKALKAKMEPIEAGKILYMNWFMIQPEVLPMFTKDLKKHGSMIIGMIEMSVGLMKDLKTLVPKLVELGKRHVKYGAKKKFFDDLRTALIQTLGEILEDEFTLETKKSWETVFNIMSSIMVRTIEAEQREETAKKLVRSDSMDSKESKNSKSSVMKFSKYGSTLYAILDIEAKNPDFKDSIEHFYKKEEFAFWQAIRTFRICEVERSKALLTTEVKEIYNKYLNPDIVDGRTIPLVKVSESCLSLIQKDISTDNISESIFDEAWELVEKNMEKRPFPRFSESITRIISETWDDSCQKMAVDKFGKILFMNFFERCPDVMPMFTKDLSKHGAMISAMINFAIESLADLKNIVKELHKLGSRHKNYGANSKYFEELGEALIKSLRGTLGDKFTPEVEKSWRVVYYLLSNIMITAMTAEEGSALDNMSDDSSDAPKSSTGSAPGSAPESPKGGAKKGPFVGSSLPSTPGTPGSKKSAKEKCIIS